MRKSGLAVGTGADEASLCQLYVALDQAYISQDQFDSLYQQAALTHAKVGGFIRYLLNTPALAYPPNQEQ